MRVYDQPKDGKKWPKWWEEDYDPDNFGTVCAVCQREVNHLQNSMAAPGFDWDAAEADNEFGSGFCVCLTCLYTKGARPSDRTIDRHDRLILQRFSAVYRALNQEIGNAKRRTQGGSAFGALQSGWAHLWASSTIWTICVMARLA